MRKKTTEQTISRILLADNIRGVLSDLDEMAGDIEAIAAVVRRADGGIFLRYFASDAETVGLLELGSALLKREATLEWE